MRGGLEAKTVITDTVCFHCQQAVEKYLKAFMVKHQIEFPKTHSVMTLINLCSKVTTQAPKPLSVDFTMQELSEHETYCNQQGI
ncbi:MAG: HEPN domain-containing protein [Euryarchaeota archaeon]|nr:HEPN domain-containing protein [Euryarchaeota archaeon]